MSQHRSTPQSPTARTFIARRAPHICSGLAAALIAVLVFPFAVSASAEPNDIAAAQTQLEESQRALDIARQQHDATATNRNAALQGATTLKDQAQQAGKAADEATRAYLRLLRQGEAPAATLINDALTAGENKDLLTGLSMAGKTSELFVNSTNVADRVAHYRAGAAALGGQAADAENVVNAIPLGERQNEVATAESNVANARNRLETLTAAEAVRAAAVAEAATRAGLWVKPVSGKVTDGFGPRPSRPAGANPDHRGTDLAAPCGTEIVAASAGKVIEAEFQAGYGNWILIEHADGTRTGYAHIENGGLRVSAGASVDAGTPIARVGSTGTSTGCHLHLEVRVGGTPVNPEAFFAAQGIQL